MAREGGVQTLNGIGLKVKAWVRFLPGGPDEFFSTVTLPVRFLTFFHIRMLSTLAEDIYPSEFIKWNSPFSLGFALIHINSDMIHIVFNTRILLKLMITCCCLDLRKSKFRTRPVKYDECVYSPMSHDVLYYSFF